MNFVDPDGNKLYFAAGVSEAFKQKFAAVVQFMNEKGTAGDLATLEASDFTYFIAEAKIEEGWNRFSKKSSTIYWDPDHIAESDEKIWISPATILAHESAHAVEYDQAKHTNTIKELTSNKSKIEDKIITTTEQIAAQKHGEIDSDQVTRTKHSGQSVKIDISQKSVKEIQEIVRSHNQALKK